MSGRYLAATAVLIVAVAAPQLRAEDAKQRGGGSGGSSSGGGHASHGSSSGGASSSSSSGGGSGYRPSGGSSSGGGSVRMTDAQRRHPRAGTGTGGYRGGYSRGGYYGGGYYGSHYYRPYYSRPYYWGYGSYPWGGLYFDSYWYGGGPSYYGGTYVRPYSETGAVRIMVDKEKAKVYVDGYYAGVVDDFDGLFQRLYVSAGRHDITLKLDGYQTERFDVYVQEGGTVKIKHDMVRGVGEQVNSEYARLDGRGAPDYDDDRGYRDDRDDRDSRDREPAYDAPRAPQRRDDGGQGALRFNVRPDDASVYVDGTFSGSARDLSRVPLPAGSHRIEIVRPGYRTYDRDVDVPSGESIDLSVDLER